VLVNRVLPDSISDAFFSGWRESQQKILAEMEEYFAPVSVRRVPLFSQEVFGTARLEDLAAAMYAPDEDPSLVSHVDRPYHFEKVDNRYEVHLAMPFATKGEVGLFKKGDELVVEIGTLRRHIGLPTTMASLVPARARLANKMLIVEMKETT
jgi:Oxyanion-translocating ATPase